MKERPILFSGAMVRALLAGTKTQTRRAIKPPPPASVTSVYLPFTCEPNNWQGYNGNQDCIAWHGSCPYGAPGDRLWVRETFVQGWPHNDNGVPDQFHTDGNERPQTTWYRATSPELEWCTDGEHTYRTPWRPSIHMPRAVSRVTLDVVGVRVERLQDISEQDAIAEGVNVHPDHHGKPRDSIYSPVQAYRDLWESINGPGSWAVNPGVWVVEFKRVEA
jgi:hypothetical protein